MKMFKALSFDDVLMVDRFSEIGSRHDDKLDPSSTLLGVKLHTPVIASNMTCVTGIEMAKAMFKSGGIACLPRFMEIDENVEMFKNSPKETFVSCGVGLNELSRAEALFQAGASRIVIDVAQGANQKVIDHTRKLREIVKNNAGIVVGNFSNANALKTFLHKLPVAIDALKIGIGGGGACLTRVVTGCGMPTFASILDCNSIGIPLIADGGIRTSGDLAKALAAGASAVMCGRLLVGCEESPAEYSNIINDKGQEEHLRKYSGSASADSYEAQGKTGRTPEGDTYWVKWSGPVRDVIDSLNGGLRSAMTYNNAYTLEELRENVEFITVSSNGLAENSAHGKD